jgi:ATP-dependent DNA helicase RecG
LLASLFTEKQISKLKKLGIKSIFDLLLHLPLKYLDKTKVNRIADVALGRSYQIEGKVTYVKTSYQPRKNLIVVIEDETGPLQLRFLNFYSSQIHQFEKDVMVRVYGEINPKSFVTEIIHPEYEILKTNKPLPEHLTPIYPLTSGLGQKSILCFVKRGFDHIAKKNIFPDHFPELNIKRNLPDLMVSLKKLHMPISNQSSDLEAYRKKLVYDELLAHQLFFRGLYHQQKNYVAKSIKFDNDFHEALVSSLGFTLTTHQTNCFNEIMSDLSRSFPMNRLLQGDVGSGKTIVATMAALQAIKNGGQVGFMAPTEILAEQHFIKLKEWLNPLHISVAFLSGSISLAEKKIIYAKLIKGDIDLLVGTHALIQDKVKFKSLALYIIDEQHRFGVEQRLQIRSNNITSTHVEAHQLMMSATPIPRTLSMSYFADMDISTISELPPGRQPIKTKIISDTRRGELLAVIQKHCNEGNQVYWVCPLIEESETLQLETVETTFQQVSNFFQSQKIALIHGRMKQKEKETIMQRFKSGDIHILVATTVIEVGVDVPNATMMIIENAERMGLSQLHQLRGRVGRGSKESTCILLYGKKLTDIAKERLRIIYENTDGFKVSESDLKLRGPGEFLGVRQSGLPSLKIADINKDEEILALAKSDAEYLLKTKHNGIQSHLQRWISNYQEITRT